MDKQPGRGERGISQLSALIILVVIAAAGVAGWLAYKKHANKTGGGQTANQKAVPNATCGLSDQDLCKFFASWKRHTSYTVDSTNTSGGKTASSLFQTEGGSKYHLKTTGDTPYEAIALANIVYIRDNNDGKWWKQTIQAADANAYKGGNTYSFEAPKTSQAVKDQPTYQKIGKEVCGAQLCLKYRVTDPKAANATQYIWFDTKDYLLHRSQTTTKDGTVDANFSYNKVSLVAPSPVKELAANQYIAPGQAQPTALPKTGDDPPSEQDIQRYTSQYHTKPSDARP